jgi:hypothetical protein
VALTLMAAVASWSAQGAQADGPWIHGTTWDLTQRFAVHGRMI